MVVIALAAALDDEVIFYPISILKQIIKRQPSIYLFFNSVGLLQGNNGSSSNIILLLLNVILFALTVVGAYHV